LLIELGFNLDMTRHYQHMAAALSLRYTQVLLIPDHRGVGTPVVSLTEGAIEGLIDTVVGEVESIV
jgi:predicted class III extradiol MEMO1 family dioxygenase